MRIRTVGWWIMLAFAVVISLYAGAGALVPATRQPFMRDLFAREPVAAFLHLLGGSIALTLGALQLNSTLRARYLGAHRWAGRVFVIAVILAGCAALMLATQSKAGLVTHIGFGMMAVVWVFTASMAWLTIRRGDRVEHRAWMIRAYAVTYAAVTLRIYLPLSLANGVPFDAAYQAISWACWVPNLLLAEWFFLRRPSPAETAIMEAA